MKYNIKRHQLLKVLATKLLEYPKSKGESIDGKLVGLTFEEVDILLKTKKVERHIILSELIKSNEVKVFNTEKSGVLIEPEIGVSALSNNKYIEQNWAIINKWALNFAQIVIPVMSLLIATVVVIKEDEKNNLKIQSLQNKVESLEENQKELDLKVEAKLNPNSINSNLPRENEQ